MIALYRWRCVACSRPWIQTVGRGSSCPFCGGMGDREARA